MGLSGRCWESVGKDRNNDISISPRKYVEDRRGLGFYSCLIGIGNGENNIRHRPGIGYCEAANRGLTQADLRQQLVITF